MNAQTAVFSPLDWSGGMEIVLLTHSTEFQKNTNTGVLVQQSLSQSPVKVFRLAWSRVAPDEGLLRDLAQQNCFLVYPAPHAQPFDINFWQQHGQQSVPQALLNNRQGRSVRLVLLDATWQLARKMYNQSPYLQQMPALRLYAAQASQYSLRRNQTKEGWCTAETVALLLEAFGLQAQAASLTQAFHSFNQR